ncbi:hypothetical protein GCM10023078_31140 [Gibbsiella greigii]
MPIKSLCLLLFTISTYPVFAQQTFEHGVLQAYWLPVWNDNGTKNTPQLKYRYFVLNHKNDVEKVINIDSNNEKSFISRLEKHFHNVPKSFTDFKEGHLEQAGSLAVDHLKSVKECDHNYSGATLINFLPTPQLHFDIDKMEKNAGCESYPYIISYSVSPEINELYFKESPNPTAKDTAAIPNGVSLVKIKTINKDWIQAAVYDESKPGLTGVPEGYVELKKLKPVN